jgi:hypothetical protein
MQFQLSPEDIAQVLKIPAAHIADNWPLIESSLIKHEIYSDLVSVAAIATIRIECPSFRPMKEEGGDAYLFNHYDVNGNNPALAKRIGNVDPGDGISYAGRGFIQLTGRNNYRTFGGLVHEDLINNPDRALDPVVAAEIFVLFFKTRGCIPAANGRHWYMVRKNVNGGLSQFDLFMELINGLLRKIQK